MLLADSSISSRYPIIFSLYGIVTLKPLILFKLIFLKSLILSMSKFKYFYDKRGEKIISEYSDNENVIKKKIPTYTPGYKAVMMVCKN